MTFFQTLLTAVVAFVSLELVSLGVIVYFARRNGQSVRSFIFSRIGVSSLRAQVSDLHNKVESANKYTSVIGLTVSSTLKALPQRTQKKAMRNLLAGFKAGNKAVTKKTKKSLKAKRALRLGSGK